MQKHCVIFFILMLPFYQRAPVRYETTRRLHLLTRHELHGTVTGLAGLRTIDSSVDGLDRLLVSLKDAKVGSLPKLSD